MCHFQQAWQAKFLPSLRVFYDLEITYLMARPRVIFTKKKKKAVLQYKAFTKGILNDAQVDTSRCMYTFAQIQIQLRVFHKKEKRMNVQFWSLQHTTVDPWPHLFENNYEIAGSIVKSDPIARDVATICLLDGTMSEVFSSWKDGWKTIFYKYTFLTRWKIGRILYITLYRNSSNILVYS